MGQGYLVQRVYSLSTVNINVDLENDTVDALTLRWIDVMNAKYSVYLSNATPRM